MISLIAPAKINLYLHVTGRLSNGYHVIDSLVAFAGIGDEVSVDFNDQLSLEISGPFARDLSPVNDNLIIRAANLLADKAGIEANASIHLTKNLPVASGLGGGSIDAAATLVILLRHWNLSVSRRELFEIATELGSDVPVCLSGKASFIGGTGEKLTPSPRLPEGWLVLANPGPPVSTPDVYRQRTGPYSEPARFEKIPQSILGFADLLRERSNDLTEASTIIAPIIKKVLETLGETNGILLSRLSGSGGTCFGLFEQKKEARLAASTIKNKQPEWWVCTAPLRDSWGKSPDIV